MRDRRHDRRQRDAGDEQLARDPRRAGSRRSDLRRKSQTLNVPSSPRAAWMRVDVDAELREDLLVDARRRSPRPGQRGLRRYVGSDSSATKSRAGSAAQRSHISAGESPDSSIARLKMPPEVASAWRNPTPASSSATQHAGLPRDAHPAAREHERAARAAVVVAGGEVRDVRHVTACGCAPSARPRARSSAGRSRRRGGPAARRRRAAPPMPTNVAAPSFCAAAQRTTIGWRTGDSRPCTSVPPATTMNMPTVAKCDFGRPRRAAPTAAAGSNCGTTAWTAPVNSVDDADREQHAAQQRLSGCSSGRGRGGHLRPAPRAGRASTRSTRPARRT